MRPEEADTLRTGARALGVALADDTLERIGRYLELLHMWNRVLRLTGERDPGTLLVRHVIDSLAPAPELPAAGLIVDVGSGAGLPGVVLACQRPDLGFALVESRRRPASFLAEVIRAVPLPQVRVVAMRAEEAARLPDLAGRAAVVLSRAVRLDTFAALAAPFLGPQGIAIAMQTPRTSEAAATAAVRAAGLSLAASRDYRLPDGSPRRLLVLRPAVRD